MLATHVDKEASELLRIIAHLGAASEVELQARTLKSLQDLKNQIKELERLGFVRRQENFFKGGYGDALELTPEGYKVVG